MLEGYKHVHYCKKCKAMLIMWNEEATELYSHVMYFANDSILEIGDSVLLDTVKVSNISCRSCSLRTTHYVVIEKEVFLQILKHSYRNEDDPDSIFKINLKSVKGSKSMEPPTLQEIKEAMVEELI